MTAPLIASPALSAIAGLRHGFTARPGGVSMGDFAGNNMSLSVGDNPAAVAANRATAAETLGFAPDALYLQKQTHSATVRVLTQLPNDDALFEGDAVVTNVAGLLLGIQTADCTPILLVDPKAGIIGAVHAGWRGAATGICEATVLAMVALGATPANITAVIGPTISAANYEVGPQFAADLLALYPNAGNRILTPAGGKEHFDLPGFVQDCLNSAGVGTVEDLGLCTYAEPARFFSHRYATHQGRRTGRQIALIGLA